MINESLYIPPAIILLGREIPSCDTPRDAVKRIKDMLKDLRDQSEAYISEQVSHQIEVDSPTDFVVHLHGGLDILAREGCNDIDCRVSIADRIAQSVGLISDRIWITDFFSEKFLDIDSLTEDELKLILEDFAVITRLMPLVKEGILRFKSPFSATCSSCLEHFESHVEEAVNDIGEIFRKEFKFEVDDSGHLTADIGRCSIPSLMFTSDHPITREQLNTNDFISNWIYGQLRSILWTARASAKSGGTILSNSRVGLAGLLREDNRLTNIDSLLLMDKQRELTVPWVSKLDASQIVQLRQEAASALPALREKLCRAFQAKETNGFPVTNPADIIDELRDQAAEVRSELDLKRANSPKYWNTVYSVLGLGLTAYGVANEEYAAGALGLMQVIKLLVEHKTGFESDISENLLKPGYVLVKAQDILAHDHELKN